MAEVPENLFARAAERKKQLEAEKTKEEAKPSTWQEEILETVNRPIRTRTTDGPYWSNEREVKKAPKEGYFEALGHKLDNLIRRILTRHA